MDACLKRHPKPIATDEIKVYKRRWVMLTLFSLYSATNAFHWLQYSIIANIIQDYYNVSDTWINWTSVIFSAVYIPLVFPANYLLDKKGLRTIVLWGMIGTCAGGIIKIFSVPRDMFWLGFLGQTLAAIAQIFVLQVPPRLATVWFGESQVSTACSIGVFGNQVGNAVAFVLPPLIVTNHDDPSQTGDDLFALFLGVAVFSVVLLLAIIFFFENEPPIPPSLAQKRAYGIANVEYSFWMSIKNLLKNPWYDCLVLACGIIIGIFCTTSTLLNQIVLTFYPGSEQDAGIIGLINMFTGMAGSVLYGFILDKTRRYKETSLIVYILSLLSMVLFTFTLNLGIAWVYVSVALLGFTLTGYVPVGIELSSELTYPEPEGTSAGFLNVAGQIFAVVLTLLYSWIFNTAGDRWANITMCIILFVGLCLVAIIRSDLKRQAAQREKL